MEIFVLIAVRALLWLLMAALLRALVWKFRPQHPRNTWARSLLVSMAMTIGATVISSVIDGFWLSTIVNFVLQAALIGFGYRLSARLSIGLGIVAFITTMVITLGATFALFTLSVSFGPAGGIVGAVLGIGAALAVMLRSYRQEQRTIEAYGADSIRGA